MIEYEIKVRWVDGFCRYYRCEGYQFGGENYWFKLIDGREKWIPVGNVRSVTIVSTAHVINREDRRECED